MKTHFDYLSELIPDLKNQFILDLGSGRAIFLVDLAKRGVKAIGLELNKEYINKSISLAKENNVSVEILNGTGENLPFKNNFFNFVNVCEVFEHVNDPTKVMQEVFRVLKSEGSAYVSVPNRFALRDPHYHLYFVNWLPRQLGEQLIRILGKNKQHVENIGSQQLSEMHYKTFRSARKLFIKTGFKVLDIREARIKKKFSNLFLRKAFLSIYKVLRCFYFDSFHFLLKK